MSWNQMKLQLQLNEMLEPESKAILDHSPSVLEKKKIISFQGLACIN